MSIIRGIWRVSGRSPVSDKPRHNISIILAMNQAIEKTLSTWQVDIASNDAPDGRCSDHALHANDNFSVRSTRLHQAMCFTDIIEIKNL
jgi:hypothetical protein